MRFLREPLVHFLALGLVLFAVFGIVRGRDGARSERITVTSGTIDHLAKTFADNAHHQPTPAEIDALVDEWVREEIYSREALALGVDRDDAIVRARLRQKMEFLVEDPSAMATPSDDDLQAYLRQHEDLFRLESKIAFRQVYLSRLARGDAVERDAEELLARLRAAGPDADVRDLGDPFLLPHDVDAASRNDIARVFGEDFTMQLERMEPGRWTGPVDSGFGAHLVLVRERSGGRAPELDDVRAAVQRAWLADRRKAAADAAYAKLRARYTVVVQRPGTAR